MKRLVIAFSIILALAANSCEKSILDVNLTEHTERRIVGEGKFTDSLKKHQFQFTLSNNLGSTEQTYTSEVSMLIKTPEGPITFNRVGHGLFESEEPFKGEYGANYTIQFSYKGNVHEVVTVMPQPINVRSYNFYESDSVIFSANGRISMVVDSPVNQYLKFDIYRADTLSLASDTIWNKMQLPVYRIARVFAGDSTIVSLPFEPKDFFYVVKGDLIKLKTHTISEDVGLYLNKLRNYVTSELVNSQFYNPPYYYSNEAYGLGYGTITDSIIFQY